MEDVSPPRDIKNLILNTKKPLIISGNIRSELLKWNLEHWRDLIKDESLPFRCGYNKYTKEPQWERLCSEKTSTFDDFIEHSQTESDEWWYFDYKHLHEWFSNKSILKDNISWTALGFPELTSKESTIWIGSKGAHTPCHVDTYGCNIVLQVYGRKLWLLFPPEENLNPSRIPYEESSIYSKLNFFSPDVIDFKGIGHCHKIVLNAGDILIVPHKWWHYVENLETAISINTWLPLPEDSLEHIKESIVAILVGEIVKSQDDTCKENILNPNMTKDMVNTETALGILFNKINEQSVSKIKEIEGSKNLNKALCNFTEVSEMTGDAFQGFIQQQSERFAHSGNIEKMDVSVSQKELINFLEVLTDDDVVSLISKKLIDKMRF